MPTKNADYNVALDVDGVEYTLLPQARKMEVTNEGSTDLLVNVPNLHGEEFDLVNPGDTGYYEDVLNGIDSFTMKAADSNGATGSFRVTSIHTII